jgi:hypothetical protein
LGNTGPTIALEELHLRDPYDQGSEYQHDEKRHPPVSLAKFADLATL